MKTRARIDKAGRVVIPKAVRDELALQPGDEIEITTNGAGATLKAVEEESDLIREKGLWMHRFNEPLSETFFRDLEQKIRDERNDRLWHDLS